MSQENYEKRIAALETTMVGAVNCLSLLYIQFLDLSRIVAQMKVEELEGLSSQALTIREHLAGLKISDPQAAEIASKKLAGIESELDQAQAAVISLQANLAAVKFPVASPAPEKPPES